MDTQFFKLRYPAGTKIISSKEEYIIEGVPKNALEFMQKGAFLGFVSMKIFPKRLWLN